MPILTYHKLGPRPRAARLKGLYVSQSLFEQQLRELQHEKFQTASLDSFSSVEPGNRVVITFDDGFANVLTCGLEPLRLCGFRAIQFIVGDCIGRQNSWDLAAGEASEPLMDKSQIRQWLAAGHEIGSHSMTHPFLSRIPIAQAREEISASKKILEDQFGTPIRHFCYPYGDWNRALADEVKAAGYATACTTEFGVNLPSDSPFSLKRLTARYRSRTLRNLLTWFSTPSNQHA